MYIPGLYSVISFKVEYGHLQCSPGDSLSDGPEILALRVSPVEDWRESVGKEHLTPGRPVGVSLPSKS